MALEKFHFEASDGTTLDVHYMMDKLSYKEMRKIRKEFATDSEAQGDAILEAGLDKEDYKKVENLSMRDLERFMSGWSESGDASLGE